MILILTPYSFNPLHPRLEYIEKYLIKNDFEVKKYNLRSENRIINKLNWLSLTFFQVPAFFKSIKYLWKYKKEIKIVYIQDLQYLPIALIAKIFRKKVIYDTLDNNVELNFYSLSNRFTFFKNWTLIKSIICLLEKTLSKYLCDEVFVNSKALIEYFRPLDTNLLYYASPFEKKFFNKNHKEIAFLYLGAFTKDKGAIEILDFVRKYHYKLYIFGDTPEDILNKIVNIPSIIYTPRVSSEELLMSLEKLFNIYSFVGFSMIHNVHYSYATQEANKDIDYLAMGIPIIANHRKPTEEKINQGCGVFIENQDKIKKLLKNKYFYQKVSNHCIEYYNQNYEQNIFEKKLLEVIQNV